MDACGLFIDMPPGVPVAAGDWVATQAGSRYLVTSARTPAPPRAGPGRRHLPLAVLVPADRTQLGFRDGWLANQAGCVGEPWSRLRARASRSELAAGHSRSRPQATAVHGSSLTRLRCVTMAP